MGPLSLNRFQSYQADSVCRDSTTAKSVISGNLSVKPIDLTQISYNKSPASQAKRKNQVHFAILYANPLVIKQETSSGQIQLNTMRNDPVDYAGEINSILKILNSI